MISPATHAPLFIGACIWHVEGPRQDRLTLDTLQAHATSIRVALKLRVYGLIPAGFIYWHYMAQPERQPRSNAHFDPLLASEQPCIVWFLIIEGGGNLAIRNAMGDLLKAVPSRDG